MEELGLRSAADDAVLQRAAELGRTVLTHDSNTLVGVAWDRVRRGETMPGVILVPWELPVGRALDRIVVLITRTQPGSLDRQVKFL